MHSQALAVTQYQMSSHCCVKYTLRRGLPSGDVQLHCLETCGSAWWQNHQSVTSRVKVRFFLWLTNRMELLHSLLLHRSSDSGLELLHRLLPGCQMLDMSFPAARCWT